MFASSASSDIPAAISACATQRSASWSERASIPVRKFEPLIAARPSRAQSPGIGIPASRIASAVGARRPPKKQSPSPISESAIWLIGARSPQAPTLPLLQVTGVIPALSSAA